MVFCYTAWADWYRLYMLNEHVDWGTRTEVWRTALVLSGRPLCSPMTSWSRGDQLSLAASRSPPQTPDLSWWMFWRFTQKKPRRIMVVPGGMNVIQRGQSLLSRDCQAGQEFTKNPFGESAVSLLTWESGTNWPLGKYLKKNLNAQSSKKLREHSQTDFMILVSGWCWPWY